MRCKICNWRNDKGTICPNCGFDNPPFVEEAVPKVLKVVKSNAKGKKPVTAKPKGRK